MNKINKALLIDFYKTAVDGRKLDDLLTKYAQKDENFYNIGGRKVLEALKAGDSDLEQEVRDMFFKGIDELYNHARESGLDVIVYSNGNPEFIVEAFARRGMNVRFVNPEEVGDKKEAESYNKICILLNIDKDDIVYLTDNKAEVKAALDAGYIHVILFDPENPDYTRVICYIRVILSNPEDPDYTRGY